MPKGGGNLTSVESSSDKNFLDSMYEFIESEKKHLPCTEADEQRYIIYSAAFDMVIERTTVYKMVLAAIKREYDNFIQAVKRKHRDTQRVQGRVKCMLSEPVSLINHHERSAQLRERIAIILKDTFELQTEINRLRNLQTERESTQEGARPSFQNPGLTVKEEMRLGGAVGHLERWEQKRPALLRSKASRLKSEMDGRMSAEILRVELLRENERLSFRNKQLKFINDSLHSWEESRGELPLKDFLSSVLRKTSELKGPDSDTESGMSVPSNEDISASWLLKEFDRFREGLFSGDNEDIPVPGARSPQGLPRDVETVERISGASQPVENAEGESLLLFIQSSMASVHAGMQLPSDVLSVALVKYALQHTRLELVAHWVTQKKLTCSETLGDVICSYRRASPRAADTCLTLAQLVYGACRARRKAAACLCSRGMTHAALAMGLQDGTFSLDDYLYLLKSCPSLVLIQGLTTERHGRPAVLSLGLVADALLASGREELAFQLLESIRSGTPGALQEAILADVGWTPEGWGEIAKHCRQQDRSPLAQEILTVLTSRDGTVLLSPDAEGAKLMEHVFM
ncbi:clathrin heavy chain linker domain-containing protein 1-like isoform X2 [Brienomyrus brachyistius]|uniref:clathrin heavy chain linker domain-containing protein 1-like isoform X2 n=1 Tax=Brienomyrus brachyistius TaxID=42636 RepID=UPI0020B4272E|nr:clathrin heavy chain linker domain-containing protein 1-like isoform X2 [Brienomyrus brachyistius]